MEFTEDIIDAMRKSFLTSQPKGDNSWRTVPNWERFLYEFRRRVGLKAEARYEAKILYDVRPKLDSGRTFVPPPPPS